MSNAFLFVDLATNNPGSSAAGEKYKQNNKQQKPHIGRNRNTLFWEGGVEIPEIDRFGLPGGSGGGVPGGAEKGFFGGFPGFCPESQQPNFLSILRFFEIPRGVF